MSLHRRQRWAYHRANSRLNIFEGSVRSGKTFLANYKFIRSLAEPAGNLPADAIDVMVGKTFSSLKRNSVLPLMSLVGKDAKLVGQELRLWNRTIYLIGANDERAEGKIRGATIRKAYGDEVTLWAESFFKMMDSRLSLDESQFIGTTNPGSANHYIKRDYLDRSEELDFSRLTFRLEDNTSLSPKYIRAIKQNYTGLWYKRFILGQWTVAEGAIYDFFEENEHVLIRPPKADYYIAGIDYATSSPTALVLMGVNRNSRPKIWAEKEYYWDPKKEGRQKTDQELSYDIKEFFIKNLGPKWQRILHSVYLDPSAESLFLQMEKDGFMTLKKANNSVVDGIKAVSTMLKSGQYAICETCPGLIDEKFSYVWDKKAQEAGIDKPKKVDDHRSDAERYGVFSEFYGDGYFDLNKLV